MQLNFGLFILVSKYCDNQGKTDIVPTVRGIVPTVREWCLQCGVWPPLGAHHCMRDMGCIDSSM